MYVDLPPPPPRSTPLSPTHPPLPNQVATTPQVKRSAYVTQDDVHLPTLTVRETLLYAARLRMEEEVRE